MSLHTRVVFATSWNSTEKFASKVALDIQKRLGSDVNSKTPYFRATTFDEVDWNFPDNVPINILFLIPTGPGGQFPLKSQQGFEAFKRVWKEAVEKSSTSRQYEINYSIIGIGDKAYGGELYCRPAIELNRDLKLLGWRRTFGLILRTEHDFQGLATDDEMNKRMDWISTCVNRELGFSTNHSDQDDDESSAAQSEIALEDLVGDDLMANNDGKPKKMLSETQRKTLFKQGYKLIGSHSAVKMCRWTKHQLRGQGGCYKHTFYGINSHQCMEATCSLACANKCVFCWRHQKNPVGTKWEWEMDPAEDIVKQGLKHQADMIRGMNTLLDVSEESYKEGMTVRHCALSLVGEPILYPAINALIKCLHDHKISTFLVTNGQFPEQLRNLDVVTQLYISIDGGDPETLKNLDRPLFSDYWERFIECLQIMKERPERTVYRMTLVKGGNDKDTGKYADLIAIGQPDFIEIKGVTFCGADWGLKMKDVPTHAEVVDFCTELVEKLPAGSYEIAAEHEHSCSVMLASKKFKDENGCWRTWINFEYFFEWANGQREQMKSTDYTVTTPDWALYGSMEKGFDPKFTRHRRNKDNKCGTTTILNSVVANNSTCCSSESVACGCGKAVAG